MGTFSLTGLVEAEDRRPGVILPSPSRPHAFQRSDMNTRCTTCGLRSTESLHIGAPANYWRMRSWWRQPDRG